MIDEPVADTKKATTGDWKLEAADGTLVPRSALDVLTSLNERVASGGIEDLVPIATGFVPMDKTIGGGLRPGELMLIGGAQGQGKTTMALQMARNMAASGQATVLYVCFEHDEEYLIQRMVAMESALSHLPQKSGAVKIQDVKKEVVSSYTASAESGTRAKLGANPRLRPSLERIARYGPTVPHARHRHPFTARTCARCAGAPRPEDQRRLVLFCRLLQRSRSPERPTRPKRYAVVSGAKTSRSPRACRSWPSSRGPEGSRPRPAQPPSARLAAINTSRNHLIRNDKYNIGQGEHEFNPYQAQRYRDWVVATIEKNRGGQDNVDPSTKSSSNTAASTRPAGSRPRS